MSQYLIKGKRLIMKVAAALLFFTNTFLVDILNAAECNNFTANYSSISKTYLKGNLSDAIAMSNAALDCPDISVEHKIDLHLLLATIHDRESLHKNTRPNPNTLANINIAAKIMDKFDVKQQAKIDFAFAEYFYRVEIFNKDFHKTEAYARNALNGFQSINDLYGLSDCYHILGLTRLLKRNLVEAREYFDRSLKIENETGNPRARILADFQRHVGFIYLFNRQAEEAVPYFERSFLLRRNAEIDDAALFAAQTLSSALVSVGRISEAMKPITYAIQMAEKLSSSYGKMISLQVLSKIQEFNNNFLQAKETYEEILDLAKRLKSTATIKSAQIEIERLTDLQVKNEAR